MKVLHLMLGQGLGGIEQVFLDYTQMLRAEGAEVIPVIHPQAAIRHHVRDAVPLRNWGTWDPFARAHMRKLVALYKPDIILTHGNRALAFGKCGRGTAKLIPVAHNYWIEHFKNLPRAIAITEDIAEKLRELHVGYVDVIPNVVMVPASLPRRTAYRKPPVIGAMGRMVHKKGFDNFLHALAKLKERGVAFNAIIGGTGEDERTLQTLAKNFGLTNSVRFIGWVEDKDAFFRDIDIFCLPSRSEPFGIVLLEAFAAGVPVVSTKNEGASTIATHEQDAILCDERQLAEGLERVIKHAAIGHNLAINGFETVKYYQPSLVGKKLKTALERAL